mgnify:CR=1 FL=1
MKKVEVNPIRPIFLLRSQRVNMYQKQKLRRTNCHLKVGTEKKISLLSLQVRNRFNTRRGKNTKVKVNIQ